MAEYLVALIKTDDDRDNTSQNPESARWHSKRHKP
jgi:hypothetical protein